MERKVSSIVEDFTEGSFDSLTEGGNNIVMGRRMAERLGAKLGDTVRAVSSSGGTRDFRIMVRTPAQKSLTEAAGLSGFAGVKLHQ